MNIVLCGYQGCGKTTVAEAFSKQYAISFIDTDKLICDEIYSQKKAHYTIREIYQLLGEQKFRELESETVLSIRGDGNTIIATGGGVLMNSDSVEHLKSIAKILYLKVDSSILYDRMLQQQTRPSFLRENSIREDFDHYIESRKHLYESCADFVLDASNLSIFQCVEIISQYRCENGQ